MHVQRKVQYMIKFNNMRVHEVGKSMLGVKVIRILVQLFFFY